MATDNKQKVEYRCKHSEKHTMTVSSIVCVSGPQENLPLLIGRIQFFLAHQHKSCTRELAVIKWIGIGIRNENNNLITVNPTTDKNIELANPLRYLDDISHPLLHAWEYDKLYILNL